MSLDKIGKKFIIIPGAQKAGTTSLYNILTKHRKISPPSTLTKETQFFTLGEDFVEKNLESYLNFYDVDSGFNLDKSTFYLLSKRTPNLIKKYIKNPKIIIILRDPAKRAYSSWLHMFKRVPQFEKREFNRILEDVEGSNYQQIKKSENLSLSDAVKEDKINDSFLGKDNRVSKIFNINYKDIVEDHLLPFKYFQGSLYSKYVKFYKDNFIDVKIVFLEELIDNPKKEIKDIYNFLDLEIYDNNLLTLPHSNGTRIPKGLFARKMIEMKQRLNKNWLKNVLKKTKIASQFNDIVNTKLYNSTPNLEQRQYEKVRQILEKEYKFWSNRKEELKRYWKFSSKNG